MLDIKIVKTEHPKQKPQDESKLGFGKIFTDHMFVMDYTAGEGWHDARIVPYGSLGDGSRYHRVPLCSGNF